MCVLNGHPGVSKEQGGDDQLNVIRKEHAREDMGLEKSEIS